MWTVKKHFKFVINTNISEKLENLMYHMRLPLGHNITDFRQFQPYLKFNPQAFQGNFMPSSLLFKFQLGNKMSNRHLLFANRILIERIVGQKLIYVKSKKHHQMFI